jgi:hypothetical protein
MADDQNWTPEELLAELRARERAKASAANAPRVGARAADLNAPQVAARGVAPRFRRLDEIPSGELARLLRARQRAIYGTDDRKETYQKPFPHAAPLVAASLAIVEASDLEHTPKGWLLRTTPYQTKFRLCASEPFARQPLGCFCSGVLVAPDVVATAGHCVKAAADLEHIRFVFNFALTAEDEPRTIFADDDVYEATALIGRRYTANRTDWALVRLDRPVVGRVPVPFRKTGRISDEEPVFVVGHPCGLPQKIAGGARVGLNAVDSHFSANLDTYGGNSGSPVFSAKSLQLEGLLVRGQTDFIPLGDCYVSQVFPSTGAGGEDVTRATEFARLIGAKDGATKRAPTKRRSGARGARKTTKKNARKSR